MTVDAETETHAADLPGVFRPEDADLLLDLLRLPTAGPLETGPDGPAPALWQAQRRYAEAAARLGFRVLHHAPAPADSVHRPGVPLTVRQAADADPEFLRCQPSLVLELPPTEPPPPGAPDLARTVMFNVHLDTVAAGAGAEQVSFDGTAFHGRGAIDAKGPAVALLAGLRAAFATHPELRCGLRVLIQAVAAEEGGALGSIGTRPLVAAGHVGRLNVFCEPTSGRALTRSTASMTARIRVHGEDAIDDRPGAGHNATVLLGWLAQRLAAELDAELDPDDGQLCIAGLHTGPLHNRVYGTGELLLNLAYRSTAVGDRLRRRVEQALAEALPAFTAAFAASPRLARTAADAQRITRLDWLKSGLPTLEPGPAWGHALLAEAGLPGWPADEPAFTCDAIWLTEAPSRTDAFTVVLGPGSLDAHHAHAPGEHAPLTELESFATALTPLLAAFHRTVTATSTPAPRSTVDVTRPRSGEHVPLAEPEPSATASAPLRTVPTAPTTPALVPVDLAPPRSGESAAAPVRVPYADLLALATAVFAGRGVPEPRARLAAEALCYGDLSGMASHGLANLTRLYLPLLDSGRADPAAEPAVRTDLGASVLLDARRSLGLWTAAEAVDLAVSRARRHGIGLVSVRNATHFGCAGFHAARAAAAGMVGLVASNCGGQRIARPPGGRAAMLGTNPLSVAAPAGEHHPFVLDMSTTVVPTGKIRAAARAGQPIPPGWLEDADGRPVTDPAAFDQGRAHLRWLGGDPETGGYKGYGLGLVVEVLSALVSGAALGPAAEALTGDGTPTGRDDDIGYFVAAISPDALHSDALRTGTGPAAGSASAALFGSLLACPPLDPARPVRYPGWFEAEHAAAARRDGVPLPAALHRELTELAAASALPAPRTRNLPQHKPR